MTLAIVCYFWHDAAADTVNYTIDDVALLKSMVERHITVPHKFVCLADQPNRFAQVGVDAAQLDMRAHVPRRIWAKLMTFSPDIGEVLGADRIVAIDLDTVIVGNIDAVVARDEPLVLWRNPGRQPWAKPEGRGANRALYNSSVVSIRPGARSDIWNEFIEKTPEASLAMRYMHDQDWISYKVGMDCPYFDDSHGIYRLGRADTPGSGVNGTLPDNACIVTFPGDGGKPWLKHVMAENPWIAEHRR